MSSGEGVSTENTLFISYPALLDDLKNGQKVLLYDGLIQLLVKGRNTESLIATVKEVGMLTANKG